MRPNLSHVIQFLLAAIAVVVLGGLAGWYFFVTKHIETTESQDAARSFGEAASFGQTLGSTYQNILTGLSEGLGIGGEKGGDGTAGTAATAPRLWNVTRNPVAGIGFKATSTTLYFIERSSGNLFTADPATSGITRVTNTLMAKTYEARIAGDGKVILRGIDSGGEITTFIGSPAATASTSSEPGPSALDGIYLPPDIGDITTRSDGRSVAYYVLDPRTGGSVGVTADWKGGAQKKVFESPLSDWRIYAQGNGIILVQKANDDVAGYALRIGVDGTSAPILSAVPGLVVLPNASSSAMLYSSSGGGSIALYAVAKDGASPIRLPIKTVADKCVWMPGSDTTAYCAVPQSAPPSNFLRDWYRGAYHTTDSWWAVNIAAGTAEQFFMPESGELDVREPRMDSTGSYLAFLNGRDGALWMLRIQQ